MNRTRTERTSGSLWRATLAALAVAVPLALAGSLAAADIEENPQAEEEAVRGAEAIMTLDFRRVPLERVLDYVSRRSRRVNIKISVDDEEQLEELKRMLVTVELTNVTWRTAVDYIAEKYRFVVNYESEASGLVLMERPPRITLNVRNAEISGVIKLIAAEARANIIIGPEVQGTVSFDIHDVPWKDALDSILKAQGFIKVEEPSGIIRITTPARVQAQHEIRAFALRYIQPQGTIYSPNVNSQYVSKIGSASTGGNAASSLIGVLNQIKSPEGSISYEQRTNMIIIKDTATRIEEMLEVIRQIDREPLQVKINVRILSETLSGGSTKGIDWTNGISAAITQGVSWQTAFPFSGPASNKPTRLFGFGDMGPLSPVFETPYGPHPLDQSQNLRHGFGSAGGTPADPSASYTLGTLSFEALQAVLKIVENSDKVKLVQSPEIVALDNQEATIHVGRIVRYAEFYVNNTDAGSESGYREVTPPIVAGVQLVVVPHVCGETDKVIMEIVPKTEDFNDEWEVFGAGTANELRLPKTSSKVVVTKMMLRSRETGVIAGLMNDTNTTGMRKVPLIGDLPVLGRAFKNETKSHRKENVLIFVTPTILGPSDPEQFQDDVNSVRDLAAGIDVTSAANAK